jgi:hypothetical protein
MKDSAYEVYSRLNRNVSRKLKYTDTLNYVEFQLFCISQAILYGKINALEKMDSCLSRYHETENDPRLQMLRGTVEDIENKPYLGLPQVVFDSL